MFRLMVFLLALLPVGNRAELDDFLSKAAGARVSAEYSCTLDVEGTKVVFSGNVTAQGRCFRLETGVVSIWCDGNALLYADPKAKEAYIEPASNLEAYISGHASDISDLDIKNVRSSTVSETLEEFKLPLDSFGSDWIITDLR